jgi:hypothetical protein
VALILHRCTIVPHQAETHFSVNVTFHRYREDLPLRLTLFSVVNPSSL